MRRRLHQVRTRHPRERVKGGCVLRCYNAAKGAFIVVIDRLHHIRDVVLAA